MQSARQTLTSAKDSFASGMESTRENWDYILREHPLVLGAVGLAIGAVAAALAPRTRMEDQVMGEARDDLLEKAKQAGGEKLEQAKQMATSAASSVKDAAADAAKRQSEKKTDQKEPWPYPSPSAVEKEEDSTQGPPSMPKR